MAFAEEKLQDAVILIRCPEMTVEWKMIGLEQLIRVIPFLKLNSISKAVDKMNPSQFATE